jgi:RNA polymerase-binding transcription factor DksA
MAMSRVDERLPAHLSREQVAQLRSRLLGHLVEHADQVAERRAIVEELTGQADSDSLLERELAETSATQFAAAVEDVREALRRMDEGTFGQCEGCGAPIPFERLEAIPHARQCVACFATPRGLLG